MSYLALLREAEKNQKCATRASVESVEIPQNPNIDTLDTSPPGPFPIFADVGAYSRWLIIQHDGCLYSHSMTPPATESEVRKRYPDAMAIEREEGP
jgi:hypothetical protein